jgi:hypothetical protein
VRSPIRALMSAALAAALLIPLAGPASAHDVATLRADATANRRHMSSIDSEMRVDDLDGPRAAVRTTADARTARCDGCEAAAVAVHVVLVDGPIESLQVDNRANAVSRGTNSTTTAISVQVVVAGAGEIHLTRDGRAQLRAIDRRIDRLTLENDLEAEVDAAVGEIVDILSTSVVSTDEPSGTGFRAFSAGPDIQVQRDVQYG